MPPHNVFSPRRVSIANRLEQLAVLLDRVSEADDAVEREDMLKFIREYINDDHHVGGAG